MTLGIGNSGGICRNIETLDIADSGVMKFSSITMNPGQEVVHHKLLR